MTTAKQTLKNLFTEWETLKAEEKSYDRQIMAITRKVYDRSLSEEENSKNLCKAYFEAGLTDEEGRNYIHVNVSNAFDKLVDFVLDNICPAHLAGDFRKERKNYIVMMDLVKLTKRLVA